MNGIDASTAVARLRQRLAQPASAPDAHPPYPRERSEPGTATPEGPVRQTPDLEGRALTDALAPGVARGALTPEGLEWLLRRQRGDPEELASALGLPPPVASGQESTDPGHRPTPAPGSVRR